MMKEDSDRSDFSHKVGHKDWKFITIKSYSVFW
jgi:hypothetical protein